MVIVILFLVIPSFAFTQVADDLHFVIKNNPVITMGSDTIHDGYKNISEIKLLSQSVIRFYRYFISSQHDKERTCVFTPSCSQFSLDAIKNYGLFYGILMTSDRLQRCNNFGIKYYHIDDKTGKFNDPVYHYYLKIF